MRPRLTALRNRGAELRFRASRGYHRGKLTTSPARYLLNEVLLRSGPQTYQLAANGDRVRIRHDLRDDAYILEEIFGRMDAYAIPPRIAERLDAVGVTKIVDLGGNIGMASLNLARKFPAATITAVEPEPENASLLQATVADNGLGGRITVLEAAASNADGSARFVGGHAGRSHLAREAEEGFEVAVVDIFPTLEGAQLLKMDIEGGEWPILADERLHANSLVAICLEYHERPEHSGPSAQELLKAAGFEIVTLHEDPPTEDGDEGVIWCVRG